MVSCKVKVSNYKDAILQIKISNACKNITEPYNYFSGLVIVY